MTIDPVLPSVVARCAPISLKAPSPLHTLGTVREGSGVVIGDKGLVLTIGYLITEADEVWLTTPGRISVVRRPCGRPYDPDHRLRPRAGDGRPRPAGA